MYFKRPQAAAFAVVILFLFGVGALARAADPVPFAGIVHKVIAKNSKVSIKDPETKKRFTVVVNAETRLSGFGGFGDIKKGASVAGKYVVTEKGLYIATEMARK